jgi:predicted DNA-binding protein
MSVSVRLNKEEEKLLKQYATLHGISVSEVIREAIFDKIEDEFDMAVAEKALHEYRTNPQTLSLEEVIQLSKKK